MNHRLLFLVLLVCMLPFGKSLAQTCSSTGNVVIFSNYDGGNLVINVNINVPDLKIGISSYEPVNVSFTGPFVGNITEVIYAGYQPGQPGNNPCNGVMITQVTAPPGASLQVLNVPPVTLISPEINYFGLLTPVGNNGGIIGCYSCSNTTYQGGFNTAEQVADFFLTQFGGSLRFLKTQYQCWCGIQNLDPPAACCGSAPEQAGVSITAIPGISLCDAPSIALNAGPGFTSYSWSTGASSASINVSNPGTYTVTTTSDCGTATAQITIEPCDDQLSVSVEDQEICPGETTSLNAEVLGGEAPFSYNWSPNVGSTQTVNVSPTTTSNYTVTVTDADGLQGSASVTVTVVDEDLNIDLGPDILLCNPPFLLDASNPSALSYIWSNGATSPAISVLNPGLYTVTLTGLCGSFTGEITLLPCLDELSITAQGGAICPGGSIQLQTTVFGGLAPFTYAWSPNIGTGSSPTVSTSSNTNYTVTVTDAEGNTASATTTVTVVIEDIEVDLGPDMELCAPPMLLDASTADAQEYNWSTGANTSSILVSSPGTYTVTVNGICGSETDAITLLPCILPLEVNVQGGSICPGETFGLTVNVNGGLAPFIYAWSPDVGTSPSVSVNPIVTTSYTVTVTDAEGSTASTTATVSVTDEDLSVNLGGEVELCDDALVLEAFNDDATGYLWNTGASSSSLVVSTPGLYTVTLTGLCGSLSTEVEVNPCNELLVQLLGSTVCPGQTTTIEAIVTGGEGPYVYSWSPPLGDDAGPYTLAPEVSQSYTVTVSDVEGSTASANTLVQVLNASFELPWEEALVYCPGDTIHLSAEIGLSEAYTWSTGSSASAIQVFGPGDYSVTIETPCLELERTVIITLAEGAELPPYIENIKACADELPLTIGLPNMGFELRWDDGSIGETLEVSAKGNYTAIYEGPCGSRNFSVDVRIDKCSCEVFVPNAFSPNGDGLNDIFTPVFDCDPFDYFFEVYNRWGDVVFETNKLLAGWNGSYLGNEYYGDLNLYVWRIEASYRDADGIIRPLVKTGNVMMVK